MQTSSSHKYIIVPISRPKSTITLIIRSFITDQLSAGCNYHMINGVWCYCHSIETTGSIKLETEQHQDTDGWPASPVTHKDSLWQACGSGSVYMCVCAFALPPQLRSSQSVSYPSSQPAGQPGPDRVKQRAGKQNEPQWQCKQTAVRPHHNHTAPCHLQRCIWLSAGRERREGRRGLVGWRGWSLKEERVKMEENDTGRGGELNQTRKNWSRILKKSRKEESNLSIFKNI